MSEITVQNSGNLKGEVEISGSKNSSLPILAACLLTKGKNIVSNLPNLSDINVMYSLLESLGARIDKHKTETTVDCENITSCTTPYELVGKMRGSFLLAGPLLARMGRARISLPGGCPIGTRPVDLHLKGFTAMGAEIEKGHGFVDMTAHKLRGAKIYLDFPSVGATENIIMAAVLADGETIIENAAAEPEIVDLTDFLIKQGAKISGSGSDTIKIEGVEELTPTIHKVISDRIEAGTFMTAFAMTRGHGIIKNANYEHIKPVAAKLMEMGVEISEQADGSIKVNGERSLKTTDIKTLPFPGFPTDMQPLAVMLLTIAEGTSIVREDVWESRFQYVDQLQHMGANIKVNGKTAVIEGVKQLSGCPVRSTDLRAGAAMLIAGLIAKGTTELYNLTHIDRGYENFESKLRVLGADITRVNDVEDLLC